MTINITTILSLLSLIVASIVCTINVVNSRRNRRTDDKKEATELTTLLVKLEAINNGINEIKSDIRNMSAEIKDLRERLVLVEASCKSAHHRVDTLEGKGLK